MLVNDIINEAGIQTAEIDRAARSALIQVFPETIKKAIKTATMELTGGNLVTRQQTAIDRFFNSVYNYFLLHRSQLTRSICNAASNALTDIAKNRLSSLSELTLRKKRIVNTLKVTVENRDKSSDSYKFASGYYSPEENTLKIFVNGNQLSDAALELITNQMQGKNTRENYNSLLGVIIPTFVHEYAHLEQEFRKAKNTADFGYITTGVTGRSGQGKRGGIIRDPHQSSASYLRYKGNVYEIDSFASQAAAEIMNTIFIEYPVDDPTSSYYINSAVSSMQSMLSSSYFSDSKAFSQYAQLLKSAFNGTFDDIGLNPRQMEKVWKRFAKKVYQKLENYKVKYLDRSVDRRLSKMTENMSKKDAIRILASDAAAAVKTIVKNYPSDTVVNDILNGKYTFDWENFIETKYDPDQTAGDQLLNIFRNMVAKRYEGSILNENSSADEQIERILSDDENIVHVIRDLKSIEPAVWENTAVKKFIIKTILNKLSDKAYHGSAARLYFDLKERNCPWPELDVVKKYFDDFDVLDPEKLYTYARNNNRRWVSAEPYIMKDPRISYMYARYVLRYRWPEAEPVIMQHPVALLDYAQNVIKGRWPEAEHQIVKDPRLAYWYAYSVINQRWPQAEPYIMKNAEYAYRYAYDVIGDRWPAAEPYIKQNAEYFEEYKKFVKSLNYSVKNM